MSAQMCRRLEKKCGWARSPLRLVRESAGYVLRIWNCFERFEIPGQKRKQTGPAPPPRPARLPSATRVVGVLHASISRRSSAPLAAPVVRPPPTPLEPFHRPLPARALPARTLTTERIALPATRISPAIARQPLCEKAARPIGSPRFQSAAVRADLVHEEAPPSLIGRVRGTRPVTLDHSPPTGSRPAGTCQMAHCCTAQLCYRGLCGRLLSCPAASNYLSS